MIELPDQTWFSPKEAAQLVGEMSVHYVYDEIERGELTAYKFGNRIRISRKDLETYIRSHEYGTTD
jgi:excisionase family DNA binding protein